MRTLPRLDLNFPIDQLLEPGGGPGPARDTPGDGTTAQEESFVFVSYSGADETWATWVAAALTDAGLTARVQAWDAPPEQDFVEWMNVQLTGARWMAALYSEAYFASYWCSLEWRVALARKVLLPVRIELVTLPETLRTLQWVDLFDLDREQARQRLLSAVGA